MMHAAIKALLVYSTAGYWFVEFFMLISIINVLWIQYTHTID